MSEKFIIDMSWEALLKNLSLNAADLLRHAQLPEDLLAQKYPALTTEQYFRFWESFATIRDSDTWLLKIVQAATPETFSPTLFAALCSPNLKSALQRLSEFKPLICPMRLHLHPMSEGICATFAVANSKQTMPPKLEAMELSFLVNLARMATRERVIPLELVSINPLTQPYHDYFGVVPKQGSHTSVYFANADLERPFLTSNAAMWEFFEPQLRQRLKDLKTDTSTHQRVNSALLEMLPSGKSSAEEVANKLTMSKRTLQRRLQSEGTSFQTVLQTVRVKLAKHYLQHERISGVEIALLLGFDSQSAFIRAFNQWTGMSPEEFRGSVKS